MEYTNGIARLLVTKDQVGLLKEAMTMWCNQWPDPDGHVDADDVRGLLIKLDVRDADIPEGWRMNLRPGRVRPS